MQKPTVGAPRPSEDRQADRDKAAPAPINRLATRAARAVEGRIRSRAAAAGTAVTAHLRPFTSAERALPIAVAAIVAVAALLAFLPVSPQGAVGAYRGTDAGVRIAVNGGINRDSAQESPAVAAATTGLPEPEAAAKLAAPAIPSFQPVTLPEAVTTQPGTNIIPEAATRTAPPTTASGPESVAQAQPSPSPTPESAVQDDGTLLTGYAPDTTVEDGSDLILTYKVQSGDTLASVAKQFGVSPMTLWWANKLKSKSLRPNAVLRIPPVSGLVYTVRDTDTLDAVATKFKVDPNKIVELNGLSDPTLVVGQVLVLPGAKGAPMPTPKPSQKAPLRTTGVTGGVLGGGPTKYSGGVFKWPVIGGNNYISQYYHYGHWAIDIAADYGSKVVAAAGGKVIFAGWKSNGGGYQVWIAHGSGIYTTYNHMSAVLVSNGQTVGKGTQVGRIGASGDATGPHLHFEVWNGKVWDGGQRVNPLRYF